MSHKARKRFGQNFLQDQNVIFDILACIQPQSGEHWIEIGPGMGALTEPLLKENVFLDVIELDRDLVHYLQNKFDDKDNLTIHSADALGFNFSELTSKGEKLRIIGNLPYNISTPLLFHLIENPFFIEDMHFMLQKEVVERICAEPGNKKYGRLSVMMQYYCETECIFYVPAESFNPIPKVMSAIVKLVPHQTPPVPIKSIEKLNKVVTTAFSQRRKTIRNSLKTLMNEEQITALEINPELRAESISLSEFSKLSNLIEKEKL